MCVKWGWSRFLLTNGVRKGITIFDMIPFPLNAMPYFLMRSLAHQNLRNSQAQYVAATEYNNFIKALFIDDVDLMNEFMNESVLGLMVDLGNRFKIISNRECWFGRCDVMIVPIDRDKDNAYIIEFKVHKPQREKDLEETAANALRQIEEKKYEASLIAEGFASENIRKYGFAFELFDRQYKIKIRLARDRVDRNTRWSILSLVLSRE